MACASHSLQASCPSPWQALPPLLWGDMLLLSCDGYGLNCNWSTWYGKVQIRNNLRYSEHPSQKLHGHICAYPTWTFHEKCWILSLFTANKGCISEFGKYFFGRALSSQPAPQVLFMKKTTYKKVCPKNSVWIRVGRFHLVDTRGSRAKGNSGRSMIPCFPASGHR